MKLIIGIPLLLIVLIIGTLAWFAHPWSLGEKELAPEVVVIEPDEMVSGEGEPSVIKLLTWNLGFLYGKGSEGQGYETREKAFYEERLNELVKQIKEWQPDIIFFQEIDFDSARSQGINQAQYVAQKAGYPYIVEAASWESNYIPFPYWPIRNNFGRMKSGGAILSRYPLSSHKVVLLPKPRSNPWWYNLFYLHRYYQEVQVEVGAKRLKLVNLHLEAFDKLDRKEQINKLNSYVQGDKVDIVAGDFNMLPMSATRKTKFDNGDDYENDPSYELMLKSGLMEVIPDDIYTLSEATYFTFPAWKPDRRLDYIFYRPELKMMKAEVLPSALSDHLPLRATFQIGSPKVNPYSL